ncbi:alpha/beta fold hydrolase [Halomonas binhaiensis]|uniref:Alpha/beta fold hydrolase n=1 Tax=Halomonas binhaiensis TaxID=2562282 RepID=A0A5C1NGX7_9GAMM|nr:alpha/beta fold hydrolase [Halomonas binhaiensis]QEM81465.1 alpha/beta fold hydrolase [Halomonas binhaiensis]
MNHLQEPDTNPATAPSTKLVLLSGWGIDARIWQPLAPYWPADISVTAPDWPGMGKRPALAQPDSPEALAKAMEDDLPADAIWVCWSLGALQAALLSQTLSPPQGLMLLGMGHRFCHPHGVSKSELAQFHRAFLHDPVAARESFLRWQASGEPSLRDAVRQLRTLLAADSPPDVETLEAGLKLLTHADISATLTNFPGFVVTLCGAQDPLLAPEVRDGMNVQLPSAGHCPMLSQPEALADTIVHQARQMRHAISSDREPISS